MIRRFPYEIQALEDQEGVTDNAVRELITKTAAIDRVLAIFPKLGQRLDQSADAHDVRRVTVDDHGRAKRLLERKAPQCGGGWHLGHD